MFYIKWNVFEFVFFIFAKVRNNLNMTKIAPIYFDKKM